ncbi:MULTISPECIES: class I SAM-dependent methyltransferase [Neobacillus]|uniref:Class I SAM-dependent methyltransferase n=1 Tax=Neobacillus rhizophilus TaxID=2833579 RepID=A0A942U7I0_9BACI|nr:MULTISPECIES: class I SAM-dependent methyltransferase [Neobacillus]MBS4213836.1 class I SAM-dependent methyltransferase [Neobacillus rhizophilus]MBU8917760.1 class I SAM-dependent methyltransferase [Bacillus sp. FJAT-29953]
MEKQKLIKIFNKQAGKYDKRREDLSQKRWRQKLLSHAEGEVLELAVGAGANFPYYTPGVKVTATDFSSAMLEKAKQAAKNYGIQADFVSGDIEKMEFPNDSFDTIVSTLSFCSYNNPLAVLEKINHWCKPSGKILLMEHGISTNFAVSILQKTLNPLLYRFYGCHHTRNILEIIRESGMTVEKSESYWVNMVHLIWAKPKK